MIRRDRHYLYLRYTGKPFSLSSTHHQVRCVIYPISALAIDNPALMSRAAQATVGIHSDTFARQVHATTTALPVPDRLAASMHTGTTTWICQSNPQSRVTPNAWDVITYVTLSCLACGLTTLGQCQSIWWNGFSCSGIDRRLNYNWRHFRSYGHNAPWLQYLNYQQW